MVYEMTVEFKGEDVEHFGEYKIEGVTVFYKLTGQVKNMYAVYKGDGSPTELYDLCETKEGANAYLQNNLLNQTD